MKLVRDMGLCSKLNFVDVDGKKIAIFAHLLQLIAILS